MRASDKFNHDYSTTEWEIKVDGLANYGYWEHKETGQGGQIWFAPAAPRAGEMTAGDAVPAEVVEILLAADYVIDTPFRGPAWPKPVIERRKR
jgi:hypothetical protein